MDNKAQISAELLIIMAAVIAVAILLIKGMNTSSKTANLKVGSNSKAAFKELAKIK